MTSSSTAGMPGYSILIPEETLARASDYLDCLRAGKAQAGARLHSRLEGADLQAMTELEFLGELLDTKQPQVFAESAVAGDSSDWNLTELGLLGDVSIAVPVTVFDDGDHYAPTPHATAFPGTLVFTPGALKGRTMFFDWLVSSFMTTMPPKPIIERCSPVLPKGRRAIGWAGVTVAESLVVAAATAVRALCLRNSRRSM